ncbi:MAG: type II secretion system protein [Tepidisphaeraceae bacterium]
MGRITSPAHPSCPDHPTPREFTVVEPPAASAGQRAAFTLVELLVVIGIIAILIGILLPVLSRVNQQARDLQCTANIRTCVQLFMTYAAENRGSLPFGWYFNKSSPTTWDDAGGDERLTTCWSLISKLSSKAYGGDDQFIGSPGQTGSQTRANSAPFMKCPEAQLVLPHICSYVVQFVAFITPYYEYVIAGRMVQDKPALLTELLPFTILLHDTAVFPGMNNDVGYVSDADVDQQRMWQAARHPQQRYYDPYDKYARVGTGSMSQNKPVTFAANWRNIDPRPTDRFGFAGYPYQGNLRFRHARQTTVNCGFADGHVEALRQNQVLRKSFMIRWPRGMGIARDPSVP